MSIWNNKGFIIFQKCGNMFENPNWGECFRCFTVPNEFCPPEFVQPVNNCINPEYYNTACETIAKRFDSCSKFYSPSTTSPSAQPSQPTPPSASTFCSTFEVTFAKMDYVSIPDIEFAILVI